MTPPYNEPNEINPDTSALETHTPAEPVPTFADTRDALGVTAVALLPFPLIAFYFVGEGIWSTPLIRAFALLPLVVFGLSLTRRSIRRARTTTGTPPAGKVASDVFYAGAFACVSPMMTMPILLAFTTLSAAVAGPILLGLTVASGVAVFVARRRQRRSPESSRAQ